MPKFENANPAAKLEGQEWVFLLLIFTGAVLFRLSLMTKLYAIGFDSVNYLKLAASGQMNGLNHVLHAYWSPFYPLVVALFSWLLRDYEMAGILVQILSGSLLIFPMFFFTRRYFGKAVAFGTVLLMAFYTLLAADQVKPATEGLYMLVAVNGVLCGWLALQKRNIWFGAASGILFGFAYLTRPEGIGFLLVFIGLAGLVWLSKLFHREKSGRILGVLVLSVCGFVVTALPYWVYLHAETGTWTLSTKGAANQQGEMYVRNKDEFAEHPFHCLNPENTVLLQDEIYHTGQFLKLTRNMEKAPVAVSKGKVIRKVVENLYQILTGDLLKVLSAPLLLLLGLGLFARPWRGTQKWLNLYLLAFVGFYWFALIPAFHITIRYFIPVLPFAFIWISGGVMVCWEWFSDTFSGHSEKSRLFIQIAGILGIVLIIFATAILPEYGKKMSKPKYSTDEWAPAIEQKKAGLWLRKNGSNAPVIMAYNHAVSFYAGNYQISESVEIPDNELSRLLAYANHRQVDYLVLNDRYQSHHPKIASLYSKIDIPAELELVYDDCNPAGLHTLIFKFNK